MTGYPRARSPKGLTGIIVLVLFVMFIFLVMWFRQPKDQAENQLDSIAQVLRPDPISQAVLNGAMDTESRTASLFLSANGQSVGEAQRGKQNDQYFFELETSLPEIDREVFFYEVWLVRPIPYDFFSVGEMVTNDDGRFVIEWLGMKDSDYLKYVQIIVTRQKYDGSSDPQEHIAKGTFGS